LKFNDEQLRVAANVRQFYDAWMDSRRALYRLGYRLYWKTTKGRDYLVKLVNNRNDGRSLGPRSPKTEQLLAEYEHAKLEAKDRLAGAESSLSVATRIYRTLRLPVIASEAAAILRAADERQLLDGDLLVVGTTAMAAYEMEAGVRFAIGMDATEDFDLAWAQRTTAIATARTPAAPIVSMLKSVDSTYSVNTERPFQARNAKAYEVEILIAPSVAAAYPASEPLRPVALPEQEWLLLGKPVDQVVCGRDASAGRIVAPDPRWFALHKLWLGAQSKRNPLKREKDLKQGRALLDAVREFMPQYPLDAAFRALLPAELVPVYSTHLAL
jgi:hypothetical protein